MDKRKDVEQTILNLTGKYKHSTGIRMTWKNRSSGVGEFRIRETHVNWANTIYWMDRWTRITLVHDVDEARLYINGNRTS